MQPRPIRLTGLYAYIPLSQNREALIDLADVPLVEQYNWSVFTRNNYVYVGRKCSTRNKQVLLHRELVDAPPGVRISHKNGDGLDNRRSNLFVYSSENFGTKYGHALWNAQRGRWDAIVEQGSQKVFLGSFTSPQQANSLCLEWYRKRS